MKMDSGTGKGCFYISKLEDMDMEVLQKKIKFISFLAFLYLRFLFK